ncbi:hypothetical protein BJF78_10130 [Pseudonocardia sp. CNS-139]|nr:hypothetical protein BJF78_10130 [Pseudonocardia sp. CNS-139]
MAAKLMALFARAVELVLHLVIGRAAPVRSTDGVVGRLTAAPLTTESRQAGELMRENLARPWRVADVAAAVASSKSQLTRCFIGDFELPSDRYDDTV